MTTAAMTMARSRAMRLEGNPMNGNRDGGGSGGGGGGGGPGGGGNSRFSRRKKFCRFTAEGVK